MYVSNKEVIGVGATRCVIGLSQIFRFQAPAFMTDFQWKAITVTAGGTLEIVNPSWSGTSTLAGSSGGWGQGYPVSPSETFQGSGPIAFYLAATGVTQTIAVTYGLTSGATLL